MTKDEEKFIAACRAADVIFVAQDCGQKAFSYIRGLSEAPASVVVKFGRGPDGKRAIRHVTIKMGVSKREFNAAVKRAGVPTP